ncbi:MAG: hypothetical protein NXI24_24900 [bacterium]|nr:hypothetical protein [bacterium]
MNLKSEWNRILSVLGRPNAFFAEALANRESHIFRDALRTTGLLLVVSTLLYFLFTLLNLGQLQEQAQAMRAYGPPSALPVWIQEGLPWNRFIFPVIWLMLIFYGGLIRHILIRLLGEPNASLARTQAVGLYASIPIIVLSVPGFALGAFFPYVPGPGVPPGASGVAAMLSTALLIAGYLWHAVVAVKALKCFYKQNTGRAFLGWIFAPFFGTFVCCGLWFGFYFVVVYASAGI